MLTTGKDPASLVLSWVVKYNIKESLTIRKSLCSFFPYTVFVPLRLDLQLDDIQSGAAGKQQKTLFSPLSVAGVCTIQEQWKPNWTNAAFGSVLLDWIRFDLFCLVSLVSRLQYKREREKRFFSLHVVWMEKKKEKYSGFFCISSNRTLHLQQFISFGIWEQIRKETRRFLFCQFTFQFNQIHVFFFKRLSLVQFSLVQFSSAGCQAPAVVRSRQFLFSTSRSDYPPLHHAHVLPSCWHQVAVVV